MVKVPIVNWQYYLAAVKTIVAVKVAVAVGDACVKAADGHPELVA